MSKPRVFVMRIIPEKGLQMVKDFCEIDLWMDELPPNRENILKRVRGADGILSLLTDRIDTAVLDAAGSQLRVISNHAVGFDNIDVSVATARGIPIGNTPGILTDATADCAFGLMMSAGRRFLEASRFVADGKWKTWGPSLLLGADFAGRTLGIVGFGRIGRAVAKRASGFDMRIIFYDPTANSDPVLDAQKVDSLETLLRESDFISLHTPLNDQTYHLINAETLSMMKSTAVLVNTSRGPVVDQEALYTALSTNQIFAAGLDVTDPEPLPMDSPLLTLDNCLILPHIASASWTTREKMSIMAAENLLAGLKGERLPHCVNLQVYDDM